MYRTYKHIDYYCIVLTIIQKNIDKPLINTKKTIKTLKTYNVIPTNIKTSSTPHPHPPTPHPLLTISLVQCFMPMITPVKTSAAHLWFTWWVSRLESNAMRRRFGFMASNISSPKLRNKHWNRREEEIIMDEKRRRWSYRRVIERDICWYIGLYKYIDES